MDSTAMQWQIRNNALEAQDYAQDLLKWQQQLKTATKAAPPSSSSSSKAPPTQTQQLPVVRGRAATPAAAPAAPGAPDASAEANNRQQHPAAHTYKNYSKWDTFDADAAAAAAEQQDQEQQPKPAAVRSQQQQQQQEPPPMPDTRRVPNAPVAATTPAPNTATPPTTPQQKAAALKDQGNKLFQARYYDDAVACYGQSIDAHPTAVAFANRAMAYLKLQRFPIEAETDCSAALLLDPAYVKAWHRRATARRQLGKLLDAASDYEEALRLEPGNAALQSERDQVLEQHLKLHQLEARGSSSSSWKTIPVRRQEQQEQQQQDQPQQPHERVQPVAELVEPQSGPQSPAAKASPQQQQHAAAAANGGTVRPVTPPAQAAAKAATGSSSSKASSAQSSPQQQQQQRQQSVAAAAHAAAQQLAARLASSLKPPKTGHEFESAWRSLKGDVALQGKYLSLLQPQQLPTLFKSSLTAQLVSALLTAALTAIAQPPAAAAAAAAASDSQPQPPQQLQLGAPLAVGLIEGLVAVPRFDMMAMSLGSRDKAALRQLWDSAAAAVDGGSGGGGVGLQEQLAAAKPKYRL